MGYCEHLGAPFAGFMLPNLRAQVLSRLQLICVSTVAPVTMFYILLISPLAVGGFWGKLRRFKCLQCNDLRRAPVAQGFPALGPWQYNLHALGVSKFSNSKNRLAHVMTNELAVPSVRVEVACQMRCSFSNTCPSNGANGDHWRQSAPDTALHIA